MPSTLEQLKKMTVVVADTGNAALVKKHKPQDCTTNPSLVLSAFEDDSTTALVASEIETARINGLDTEGFCDTLTVAIGANLSTLVPGRVSTEVDARYSFDVDKSVRRAHEIVADYDRRGVGSDRILIKLAATWEGICAAEKLEKEGINCNLTLLFSMAQAKACADAGVFLISPFVGRISDWYKRAERIEAYDADHDPGVRSVREIYDNYKSSGVSTIVMGASFRSTDQIKALAGCDRLTISPQLLSELEQDEAFLSRSLQPGASIDGSADPLGEPEFRWDLNGDAMATDLLADGIRRFDVDHKTLLGLLTERLSIA